jgi:hypothetical protein
LGSIFVVKRAIFGKRALGKIAGIVFVIDARCTEIPIFGRSMQSHARMPIGFEHHAAMGAGDRLSIHRLMTSGTFCHAKAPKKQ